MKADSHTTVGEITAIHPQAARIFESFGIDYCCGGRRSLEEAARLAGVAPEILIRKLEEPVCEDAHQDWNARSLPDLADHIVTKHHVFVRREIPRLNSLLEKVIPQHGAAHPELRRIAELFQELSSELTAHMMKEEQILFPMISELGAHASHCPIQFPIRQMMAEHDDAGYALAGIRAATGGFHAPEDACASLRALYAGLEEFERDLHLHIHLENNILFPRAIAMTSAFESQGHVER
jgi:regulator of cell morphogenesis and NO signaling